MGAEEATIRRRAPGQPAHAGVFAPLAATIPDKSMSHRRLHAAGGPTERPSNPRMVGAAERAIPPGRNRVFQAYAR